MTLMDIGICSWAIDRYNPLRAIELANDQFGFSYIQLGFFSLETIKDADASRLVKAAKAHQVSIISTFAAFEREDYTSIETIAQTGGYMSPGRLKPATDGRVKTGQWLFPSYTS